MNFIAFRDATNAFVQKAKGEGISPTIISGVFTHYLVEHVDEVLGPCPNRTKAESDAIGLIYSAMLICLRKDGMHTDRGSRILVRRAAEQFVGAVFQAERDRRF